MSSEVAADLLASLGLEECVRLFREIRPEYAADIYHIWSHRDPEWAEAVLERLGEEERRLVRELGQYPPGTAGAAMIIRFLAIPSGSTVGETVDAIRGAPPEVERSAYVYVLAANGRGVGVISVRDLFLAERDQLVDRIAGVLTREDAFELLAEELAAGFARSAQASPDESFFTPLPWRSPAAPSLDGTERTPESGRRFRHFLLRVHHRSGGHPGGLPSHDHRHGGGTWGS
jgi:Mg/Co/Ni transporter MgtE